MPIDIEELRDLAIEMVSTVSNDDAEISDAVRELKEFFDRNNEALINAGVTFAVEMVAQAMTGSADMDAFTKSLDELSAEELVAIVEADAAQAFQNEADILGKRQALIDDLKATLGKVARAALGAGIAALTGLA